MNKKCRRCKETKDVKEFPSHTQYKDGYRTECKLCYSSYKSKLFKAKYDKEKSLARDALGNRCVWCGEDDSIVLVIDHVNNDGQAERKKWHTLKILRAAANDTEGRYQLLCRNCNWRKKAMNDRN